MILNKYSSLNNKQGLTAIRRKKTKLCIGLMSGTSMDSIDAALVRITGSGLKTHIEVVGWHRYPFPHTVKGTLFNAITIDGIQLSRLSQLNFLIGEVFAEAVLKLLKKFHIDAQSVDLIGSHGQTVWHHPQKQRIARHFVSSTLQIGEPAVISARTGIPVVADFRVKDVALGGEGAPLIPYFDYLIFRSNKEHRGVLNLGGIANITVLPKNCTLEEVYAFDTGPGNMVIDELARELFNQEKDTSGAISASAPPHKVLLSCMMNHPFIRKHPPKSSGREEFGTPFTKKLLKKASRLQLSTAEIISTATEYTARAIEENYIHFIKPNHPLKRIIVSGGGINNVELMSRLKKYFSPIRIETSDDYGIPAECKEAVAFAVFANETICGNPINIPKVTGAEKPAVCGKIIV
jgi:anhydro-N-acetylmuramic acid kinase